jgi:hypothetical protein
VNIVNLAVGPSGAHFEEQMTRSPDDPMRAFAYKLRSTEASEIAEAAVVLPVVFLFLLGVIWFGRAFNIYATIQQAAQQGAITAARPVCATCDSLNTTPFPSTDAVDKAVSAVMQASSVDPAQIVNPGATPPSQCAFSTSHNITICQVVLNSSSTNSLPCDPSPSQICGTMVTFQYPFQFYLPYTSLNLSKIILTAQAESRTEY